VAVSAQGQGQLQ